MLKHFKAVNVQEPEDRGAPPAGALRVLGPVVQPRAWVPVFGGTRPQASPDGPLRCLRGSTGRGPRAHLGRQRPVDLPDQPGKSAAVHGLGKSVSCIRSLLQVQWAQELQAEVRQEMNAMDPFPSPSRTGSGCTPDNHDRPHRREDGIRTGGRVPGGARPWSTCTPRHPSRPGTRAWPHLFPLGDDLPVCQGFTQRRAFHAKQLPREGCGHGGVHSFSPQPLCPHPLPPPLTLVRYLSWFSVVTWALLSSSAAKWMLPKCRTLATMLSRSWANREGMGGSQEGRRAEEGNSDRSDGAGTRQGNV